MTVGVNASRKYQLGLIWSMILIASPLGIIPWRTVGLIEPFWQAWIHGLLLLMLFSSTIIYEPFKPLRRFASIIVILFFMGYGGGWDFGLVPFIRSSEAWITWETGAPLAFSAVSVHILRLAPAFVIITFLLLSGRRREDFYLVKGDIHATVEPSRLFNKEEPDSWKKILAIFTVIFVAVATIFMIGSSGVTLELFAENWYLIPIALIIAAINGFNEEFSLRAAPLSEIEPAVGKDQSLLATATYFGLGHYYGYPSGIIGVLLSGFFGWLLGRSMLETKGFTLAWLVHFLTDIPIFLFIMVGM